MLLKWRLENHERWDLWEPEETEEALPLQEESDEETED